MTPQTPDARRFRADAGVTLIEMLIVVLLIGLVSAIVAINVLPSLDRGRTEKAKSDIAALQQALEMFRIDYARYPTAQEGLEGLVTPPAGEAGLPAPRTQGYIRALPKDPWGRDYIFANPGPANAPYEIATLGADGREGGEGANADVRSR